VSPVSRAVFQGSAGCGGGSGADEGQDGELADEEEEREVEEEEEEEEAKRVGKRSCAASSPAITKGEYVSSSLTSAGSE
jgi:hypothetical protein